MPPLDFIALGVLSWFAALAVLDMFEAAHDACRDARNRQDDACEKAARIDRERRILMREHLHPAER